MKYAFLCGMEILQMSYVGRLIKLSLRIFPIVFEVLRCIFVLGYDGGTS